MWGEAPEFLPQIIPRTPLLRLARTGCVRISEFLALRVALPIRCPGPVGPAHCSWWPGVGLKFAHCAVTDLSHSFNQQSWKGIPCATRLVTGVGTLAKEHRRENVEPSLDSDQLKAAAVALPGRILGRGPGQVTTHSSPHLVETRRELFPTAPSAFSSDAGSLIRDVNFA